MLAGVMTAVPLSADAAETAAAAAADSSGTYNDFEYYISDSKAEIVAYKGTNLFAQIPETIDGCPVISINDEAFVDNTKLRTVIIPKSVTYIGDGAFDGVVGTVLFKYAGTKADWDNIHIGANNDAIKPANIIYCSGEVLQYKIIDGKAKIYGTNEKEPNLVIPSTIESCPVDTILAYAFSDCHELESITLPDSVTSIGYEGFSVNNVKRIILGSGLNDIAESAFLDNYDLADVYYNGTEEDWAKITIGNDNNDLLNANLHFIPEDSDGLEYHWNTDGTLYISGYHGAKADVTIPAKYAGVKVTSVGYNAFYYDKTIKSVTIPSSVKSVGTQAFIGAEKLAKISLTEGLETIATNAFRATAIETIVIPSTVKRIGSLAFFKCAKLSDVTIQNGVAEIDRGAFADCAMKSVTIPASATSLDSYSFGCLYESGTGKYTPIDNFVIYGTKGSAAEKYAAKNGFTFVDSSEATIDTINITNLYVPRVGKTPADTADTDGHYTVESISWYDVYSEKWMSSSETVKNGKQYEANIHVLADKGYQFISKDSITATVNGSPAEEITSVPESDPAEYLNIRITFPAVDNDLTEVSQIDVTGITAPEELAEISKTADAGIYCNVVNVNWYDVEGNKWMKDGERFVKHKQYEANVNVRAVDGCEFVDISKVKATVNGKEATVDRVTYQDESEYLNIRCTFTAEPKFISYVSNADITGVVEPKAGEKAVFTFDENPYFTVKNNVVDWYSDADHYNLKEGDVFEEGKRYRAYFMITVKDGYKFTVGADGASSVKSTVNGKAAETQTLTSETYDAEKTIRIRCDFTATSSSTEPQETTAPTNPIETQPQETTAPTNPIETQPQETTKPEETTAPTEPHPSTEPECTDISDWDVSGIKNKTYTGKAIKQSVKVTKNGSFAEFEATYTNNVNVGTATVKLVGIGEYKGSITKTFRITKAKQPMKVTAKTKTVKLTKAKKAKQTVKKTITVKSNKGAVTYAKVKKGSSKYLSISKKGVITVSKYKKYKKNQTLKIKVKVTAKGNKNYASGSKTVTVKITIK